jgi:D-erythronate 2-dehydrogenase
MTKETNVSNTVLVTGAFGLVGSATVRRLGETGRTVVATDLDTPANRKAARKLPAGTKVSWADLTDSEQLRSLVSGVSPAAIVHLAAVIPPAIYRSAELARKVNVEATDELIRAAESLAKPPRFVMASTNAVHGARNPHRSGGVLRVDSPVCPSDLYGGQKAEAEARLRSSRLEWVVLRLAGVIGVDANLAGDRDALYFGGLLPTDGRVHTVDVRDVAVAFEAALTADVASEILLIGGDASHHLRQGEVAPSMAAAMGLVGGLPPGRPGDPDSAENWFATDWMDTSRAQQALAFQNHSWPEMLEEVRRASGWTRHLLKVVAPIVRRYLELDAPYRSTPGNYADPWSAIRARWGEPRPDIRA